MTDIQKIERIAKRHGEDRWRFYARYSGRGMFGDHCPGIVCPPCDVLKVVAAVRRSIRAIDGKVTWRQDNLGKDAIVYFPGLISTPEEEAS